MIRETVINKDNSWNNIIGIELGISMHEIIVDSDYIGLFQIEGFHEKYNNIYGRLSSIKKVDYVLVELHKDLIGEIEFIRNNKKIDYINILFEDGFLETLSVPKNQNLRVTSLGDLRIEMGEIPSYSKNEDINQINKIFDFSESAEFGKNWIINNLCEQRWLYNEPERTGFNETDKTDYNMMIKVQTENLMDILGEIVRACEKKIGKEKLIALATILDYNVLDTINVKQYTFIDDNIRNIRIEQLISGDYTKRRVKDNKLKNAIHKVCEDNKKKSLRQLESEIIQLEQEQF